MPFLGKQIFSQAWSYRPEITAIQEAEAEASQVQDRSVL